MDSINLKEMFTNTESGIQKENMERHQVTKSEIALLHKLQFYNIYYEQKLHRVM